MHACMQGVAGRCACTHAGHDGTFSQKLRPDGACTQHAFQIKRSSASAATSWCLPPPLGVCQGPQHTIFKFPDLYPHPRRPHTYLSRAYCTLACCARWRSVIQIQIQIYIHLPLFHRSLSRAGFTPAWYAWRRASRRPLMKPSWRPKLPLPPPPLLLMVSMGVAMVMAAVQAVQAVRLPFGSTSLPSGWSALRRRQRRLCPRLSTRSCTTCRCDECDRNG